ncbi:MAG: ice-binding family protein [Planctomycetota bacterium]
MFIVFIAGCSDDEYGNGSSSGIADTTPPTVAFVNPANLATDVPLNRKIAAAFSEAMDPLTLTTATFSLRQGTTPVSGAVATAGTMATFTPAGNLMADTLYTATVGIGTRDLAGNALKNTYVWTFITGTTSDITLPTVVSVSPVNLATNVPISRAITATFSEAIDPLSLTTASFTLKLGTTPVTGTVACAGTVATFMPAGDLASSATYTAEMTTGVEDLAGNALASNYVWDFTTGAAATVLTPVALGQASHFAVLAGYAITNIPTSNITGDVGISPAAETFITGFSQTDWTGYAISAQVSGFIYASDMASPTPAMLTEAKGDLAIAINDATGRSTVPTSTFLNPGAGNLAGLTLVAGLYKFTGEATATTGFTLSGGANDVWIFQIASNLNVSDGVHVTLADGANANNIFWQVGTEATLGVNVVFHGTIMANAAITLNTGAALYGRALAFTGTVALDQNVITLTTP